MAAVEGSALLIRDFIRTKIAMLLFHHSNANAFMRINSYPNRACRATPFFYKRLFGIPQAALCFVLMLLLVSPSKLFAQQTNLSCSLETIPFVNDGTAGFTGLERSSTATLLSSWANRNRVIDNNLSNYATATIAVSGTVTFRVTDPNASNTYSAGNFAGFLVEGGLLNLAIASNISISTYLDENLQETFSGTSLISLSSTLLGGADELGFYTNLPLMP